MRRSYHTLFWDNDGVLVETEQLYYQANREALAAYGIHLSLDQFSTISLRLGQSVLDLANDHLDPQQRQVLRQERNHRYNALLASQPLLRPGVRDTLQKLHGRVRMAIVTSSRRVHFDLIHANTGILDMFDFILTREDYHHSKPHPDPYHTALKRTTAEPKSCLVIEDTPRGLQAAHRAGLDCLVIPNALLAEEPFPEARGRLQSVAEIFNYLPDFSPTS